MMTKSSKDQGIQADLFKPLLVDIISMSHELVLLEKAIDWKRFEEVLAPAYCKDNGRPSIPVRMISIVYWQLPRYVANIVEALLHN